jgi:hypothetical protein
MAVQFMELPEEMWHYMNGCKLSRHPSPLSCVGYDKSLTEFLCSAAYQQHCI